MTTPERLQKVVEDQERAAQSYEQSAQQYAAELADLKRKYTIDDRGRYVYVRNEGLSRAQRADIVTKYKDLNKRIRRSNQLAGYAREKAAKRVQTAQTQQEIERLRKEEGLSRSEALKRVGLNQYTGEEQQQRREQAQQAQKEAATLQRQRFVASGESKFASQQEVQAARRELIRRGEIIVSDAQSGAQFQVQPGDKLVAVRQKQEQQRQVVRGDVTGPESQVWSPTAANIQNIAGTRTTFEIRRVPYVERKFGPAYRAVQRADEYVKEKGTSPVSVFVQALQDPRKYKDVPAAIWGAGAIAAGETASKVGGALTNAGEAVEEVLTRERDNDTVLGRVQTGFQYGPGGQAFKRTAQAAQFIGGVVSETGDRVQEKPLTAGATEAVLLGTGVGIVDDVLVRGGRASIPLVSKVSKALLGTERTAGVVLGGAFAADVVVRSAQETTIEGRGRVVGDAAIEAAGFGAGFKAGRGAVAGVTNVKQRANAQAEAELLQKRMENQLVPVEGTYKKVGERPVSDNKAKAESILFEARREQAKREKLLEQKSNLLLEIKKRETVLKDYRLLTSGKQPNVKITQLQEGQNSGFMTEYASERDLKLAKSLLEASQRFNSREVPGSPRMKDRGVFRAKNRKLDIEREVLPQLEREIKSSEERIYYLFREARKAKKQPDVYVNEYRFYPKDREVFPVTNEVGVEIRGRPVERDIYDYTLFERGGQQVQEVRGYRQLGPEELLGPEQLARPGDTFLASATVTRVEASVPGTGQAGVTSGVFGKGQVKKVAVVTARDIQANTPLGPDVGILRTGQGKGSTTQTARAVVEYQPFTPSGETGLTPPKQRAQSQPSQTKIGYEPPQITGNERPKQVEQVVRFLDEPGPTQTLETSQGIGFVRGRAQLYVDKVSKKFKLQEYTLFRKFERGLRGIPGRPSVSVGTITDAQLTGLTQRPKPVQITSVTPAQPTKTRSDPAVVETTTATGQVVLQRVETVGKTEQAQTAQTVSTRQEQQGQQATAQEQPQQQKTFQETITGQKKVLERTVTTGTKSIQDTITKTRQGVSLALLPATRTRTNQRYGQAQLSRQDQTPAQDTIQDTIQDLGKITELVTRQDQTPAQDTIQETTQRTRTTFRFTPRFTPPRRPIPEEPGTPPPIVPQPPRTQGTPTSDLVSVEVRRGGVFRKQTTNPLAITDAVKLADRVTDTTAARSVKFTQEGKPVTGETKRKIERLLRFGRFRKSKVDSDIFVEKSQFAISTAGEKAEIRPKKSIFSNNKTVFGGRIKL